VSKRRNKRFWRWKLERAERQFSQGAASAVRHIDPATVEIPQCEASERPKVDEKKVLADQADKLLRNDMRRRFGQKAGDRAYFQIKAERYTAPDAAEAAKLSRAQRKRIRRKTYNKAVSKHRREAWRTSREQATHSYSVEGLEDGQCYVRDQAERVAGPFASNAAAWAWIDRHTVARRYAAALAAPAMRRPEPADPNERPPWE
jgi:hypothetical protein